MMHDFLENIEARALQAWATVESALRKVGTDVTVIFDDPVVPSVILWMGGWTVLCNLVSHEIPFYANQFINRYQYMGQNKLVSKEKNDEIHV